MWNDDGCWLQQTVKQVQWRDFVIVFIILWIINNRKFGYLYTFSIFCNNNLALTNQSFIRHLRRQKLACIVSWSIISQLEFTGFPRSRGPVSGNSCVGGRHQTPAEAQPVAMVPGATIPRRARTCSGPGFFPRQRQHVGSLPAAAGHR
jgi:hypothetical protein